MHILLNQRIENCEVFKFILFVNIFNILTVTSFVLIFLFVAPRTKDKNFVPHKQNNLTLRTTYLFCLFLVCLAVRAIKNDIFWMVVNSVRYVWKYVKSSMIFDTVTLLVRRPFASYKVVGSDRSHLEGKYFNWSILTKQEDLFQSSENKHSISKQTTFWTEIIFSKTFRRTNSTW